MNVKYVGIALTSLGLAAAVAALPAQQELPGRRQSPDQIARDLADATSDSRQGDSFTDLHGSSPFGLNKLLGQNESSGLHKLALQESVLAREADLLKHDLERAQSDAQRSEIRTKLTENIGKQFDLRQKKHAVAIETLEAQVKKLKELVRKRQEGREEIVSRRVEQTLREADGLGW